MKNLRKRTDSTSSSLSSHSSRSRSGSFHSRNKEDNRSSKKRSRSPSREPRRTEYVGTNSKDPKMVASRIFVGNLPTSAGLRREDVELIFKKYGRIIGLLLMSGYAFVQYDNEESAINAKQENGSIVKGCCIEVRVANEKKRSNHNLMNSSSYLHPPLHSSPYSPGGFSTDFYPSGPPPKHSVMPFNSMEFYRSQPLPLINNKPLPMPLDCEIILVDEGQKVYGEVVMKRLLAAGLSVESKVLPFDSNTLSMVELASRKGTLFAIIINEQNEIHGSITVNILHGSAQEHRNMPLEDALTLITRKFDKYMITKKERLASAFSPSSKSFSLPGSNVVYLLNLLADGRFLTLKELDVLLEYINGRRESILKSEGLSNWGNPLASGQCEDCLIPEKIHRAVGSGVSSSSHAVVGPSSSALASKEETHHKGLTSVINDPLIQKALDSLFTSGPNLLKTPSSGSSHMNENLGQDTLFPSAPNISMVNQGKHSELYQRQAYSQQSRNERSCGNDSRDMSWLAYAGN